VKWVKPFLQEVSQWERRLTVMGEVLAVWLQVQLKWLYLEPKGRPEGVDGGGAPGVCHVSFCLSAEIPSPCPNDRKERRR